MIRQRLEKGQKGLASASRPRSEKHSTTGPRSSSADATGDAGGSGTGSSDGSGGPGSPGGPGNPGGRGGSRPHRKKRTVSWSSLPDWQKDNHFILAGYVPETSSLWKCVHSLFYVHNETGNIYSHLIPGLALLGALLTGVISWYSTSVLFHFIPHYGTTTWRDHVALALFVLGCASCLGLSGVFHCFKSHSEQVAKFGNKLDYLGIVLLTQASMTSLIYYGFHGMPQYQLGLGFATGALGTGCAVASLSEKFREPNWRAYRALMFVAYGLSGALPVIVGIRVFGLQEGVRRIQLPWVVGEAVLYITGAGLYASRIPERFKPGFFDLWGHSHQIFHIFVLLAAYSHGRGLLGSYEYIHTNLLNSA